MLILAGVATYQFRTKLLSAFRPVQFNFQLSFYDFIQLAFFVSLIFLAMYALVGLYSMKERISRAREFIKIIIGSSAGLLAVIIIIFLRQELFNSRFLVLGGWFFAILFVFIGRLIVREIRRILVTHYDFGVHRLLLIGDDRVAQNMRSHVESSPASGYRLVKHLEHPDFVQIKEAVDGPGIDEIILAHPHYPPEHIQDLVQFCQDQHIVFKFVPNIYETLTRNFDVDIISGVPVIELKRTPLDGWGKVAKRTLDISTAILGLVISSPIFLILAIVIPLNSDGPVFAKLKRISRNKEFYLYKFRSMVKNAEELKPTLIAYNERGDGPLFKMNNDPRITSIGRFIRKYRIDELPQLFNVLNGDISLVGPRPHEPAEVAQYQTHHKKVLAIKAGATGLAQVSGASDLPFEQEVAYDSFYIEHWSLYLDLKIIFKTIFKVLNDRSAV